jgi:exopolysaccharide biosynthesis polyprenyl glycosylphosphotransferase
MKRMLNWLVGYEVALLVALTYVAVEVRNLGVSTNTSSQLRGTILLFAFPIMWLACLALFGAWDLEIFKNHALGYQRLMSSSFGTFLFFCSASYLFKIQLSRFVILFSLIGGTLLHLAVRWTFLKFADYRLELGKSDPKWLLLGENSTLERHIEKLGEVKSAQMVRASIPLTSPEFLDWVADLKTRLESERFESIYLLGVSELPSAYLQQLIWSIEGLNIQLLIPDKLGLAASQSKLSYISGEAWSILQAPKIDNSARVFKRSLDLFLSFIALVIFSPLYIIIATLIKVTSRGPIFYTQKRIGKDDALFNFPKFRTMYQGADKQRLEILGRPDEDMKLRYKNDPRITPVGRALRRFSLDELPQLWCVLRGTMSLVGPRPMLPEEQPQLSDLHFRRHIAKPGLTGLWQVSGRKETSWEERMAMDIQYVQQWSVGLDLILITRTFKAIATGEGSY